MVSICAHTNLAVNAIVGLLYSRIGESGGLPITAAIYLSSYLSFYLPIYLSIFLFICLYIFIIPD